MLIAAIIAIGAIIGIAIERMVSAMREIDSQEAQEELEGEP